MRNSIIFMVAALALVTGVTGALIQLRRRPRTDPDEETLLDHTGTIAWVFIIIGASASMILQLVKV